MISRGAMVFAVVAGAAEVGGAVVPGGSHAARWVSDGGTRFVTLTVPSGQVHPGVPAAATLSTASGGPLWCSTMPQPSAAFVCEDGAVVTVLQRTAARIGRRREEGVRFYSGSDGRLMRFISAFFFPAEYVRGVRRWYDEHGSGLASEGRFRLRLINGFSLVFCASTGRLSSVSWSAGSSPTRTLASWFGTPGLRAASFTLVVGNAVYLLCAWMCASVRRGNRRNTGLWCDVRQYPYLLLFSAVVFGMLLLYANLRWAVLFLA